MFPYQSIAINSIGESEMGEGKKGTLSTRVCKQSNEHKEDRRGRRIRSAKDRMPASERERRDRSVILTNPTTLPSNSFTKLIEVKSQKFVPQKTICFLLQLKNFVSFLLHRSSSFFFFFLPFFFFSFLFFLSLCWIKLK